MKIDQHTDPMAYQPDMEITSSAIMEQVLAARAAYDETVYTADDVKQALLQDHLTPEAFAALLAPAAAPFLEQLAQRAQAETRKHFCSRRSQHHFWNSWHKGHRQKHVNISVMPSICSPRFISPTTAKITASTAALTATTISNAPSLLPLK